jgi:hypothetical protein
MEERIKNLENQISQVKSVIETLDKKEFNLYFFVLDTKGNPTGGVANIYEHVKLLNELGYHAHILHEKNDYKLRSDDGTGIADWLGEEYAALPHISIESQQLKVTPSDFILIPEIFSNIMEQIKGFPCKKIVFLQTYNYALELLGIGKRWNSDYGFNDVITTCEKQAIYVSNHFPSIRTHIVPVSIAPYFKPSAKPKIPVVTLVTRDQTEAIKIAKSFYLQYPVYKWVTFRELRGLPKEKFAEELSKSCLAVWVDDVSGFGTFPLEAIECETPVIGKIPNMIPEWMEEKDGNGNMVIKHNGIWTNTTLNIPELIATYMKAWLEDAIINDLTDGIKNSKGGYTPEKQKAKLEEVYTGIFENRKLELNTSLNTLNQELNNIELKAV